jgi:hypothetical protein
MQAMTRAHKISNLLGAVVPFLAFIAAIVLEWWEIDATAVIRTLERLGPAWNVVEISPERQAEKQAPRRSAVAA